MGDGGKETHRTQNVPRQIPQTYYVLRSAQGGNENPFDSLNFMSETVWDCFTSVPFGTLLGEYV